MTRNFVLIFLLAAFLAAGVACSKRGSNQQLVVEIPAGFSGTFVLNMGVREAPALQSDGRIYFVSVPANGKVETSTFLDKPKIIFRNSSNGSIWGFSQSVFTTGDGISVGGKIEFFVGSQKEFEAEQQKKNKSGGFSTGEPVALRV